MAGGVRFSPSCPGLTRASTIYFFCGAKDVDGWVKPGHDERETYVPYPFTPCFSDAVAGLLLAPETRT